MQSVKREAAIPRANGPEQEKNNTNKLSIDELTSNSQTAVVV